MKKILLIFCVLMITGCSSLQTKDTVIIYSSMEDYRNDYLLEKLHQELPDVKVQLEYMSSGEQAARLYSEGDNTLADICLDLQYGYLPKVKDILLPLDSYYDFSVFSKDVIDPEYHVLPLYKNGGAIVVNLNVLKKRKLPTPTCYEDLLKPIYKNLIAMPSPKSSGTGYMFYKSLMNSYGEEKGKEFFDQLSKNVLQYTTSGSGPVKMLIQEEIAIGLAMTGQAVNQINEGVPLKILYFSEGSPYSMYGSGIIKSKVNKKNVKRVFDYIYEEFTADNNRLFFPEQIYQGKINKMENFPENIKYADMSNDTAEEKSRLLWLWNY